MSNVGSKLINTILLLLLLVSTAFSFEYGAPVVWRKTQHRFMKGLINVELNIVTPEPCSGLPDGNQYLTVKPNRKIPESFCHWSIPLMRHMFGRYNITPSKQACELTLTQNDKINCTMEDDGNCSEFLSIQDYLIRSREICQNQAALKFYKQVKKACPLVTQSELKKREVATVLLISGIFVVGSGAFISFVQNRKEAARQLKINQEYLKIMKIQTENMEKIAEKLIETSAWLDKLQLIMPDMMFSTAEFVHNIERQGKIFERLSDTLKEGTIDPNFFKEMNIDLNCTEECDLGSI